MSSPFLAVFLAGISPILFFGLLLGGAYVLGQVAWRPPVLWENTFGTASYANAALHVTADSSGAYVQGYLNDTMIGNLHTGLLFLDRFDSRGVLVWSHTVGNASDSYVYGMWEGTDGVYLTGSTNSGGLVQKYSSEGVRVWTRQFGTTPSSQGQEITGTSTTIYDAGVSTPLTNQSFTGPVVFVRSYDFNGYTLWTRELTNSSGANVYGIYGDASGVYLGFMGPPPDRNETALAGNYLAKFDPGGNLLWERSIGMSTTSTGFTISGYSGGVYLVGTTSSSYSNTPFLAKYDRNGNLAWSIQIQSPDGSSLGEPDIDASSSGVYVSLPALGQYLQQYDSQGEMIWSLQVESRAGSGFHIAVGSGLVYLAGSALGDAVVAGVGSSPSLIFFGLNPPLSFIIIGCLVGLPFAAGFGTYYFRKMRGPGSRPSRVGPSAKRKLPIVD